MEVLLVSIIMSIYQLSFYKTIKNFKIKKRFYFISTMFSLLICFFFFEISLVFLPLLLLIQTLVTLSFIDYFHYEVDKNSYYYLIIPTIIIYFLNGNYFTGILSFALIFFILFFIETLNEKFYNYKLKKNKDDKIVLEEEKDYGGIGGADIKIILILSICFDLFDGFSFAFNTVLFTTFLYIILCIKNRKFSNIKIPMIISITIAFIYSYYFYLNYFLN